MASVDREYFLALVDRNSENEHWSAVKILHPSVNVEELTKLITEKDAQVQVLIHKDIHWDGRDTDFIELQRHPWNGVREYSRMIIDEYNHHSLTVWI